MGWPSECQRDGFLRAPSHEGGELVDADVERVAGAERRAPVGGLLGGGVDGAGGGRAQHSLHGGTVEDFDLVVSVLIKRLFRSIFGCRAGGRLRG